MLGVICVFYDILIVRHFFAGNFSEKAGGFMKQHIENFLDVPGPDPKNSIKTTYRKGELRCLIRLMNYWITNNTLKPAAKSQK